MRFRSLLLAPLFIAALSSTSYAAITVQVDKTTQSVTVSRDGALLHRWPVSTGRRGHDTPNGTYRAFRMEKDHFSKEWDDAPMPNSIFFTKRGHALHGYLDTKNIGRPASHGCVRLRPENAAALYALVEQDGVLNTTVSITGELPAASPAPVARQTAPDTRSPRMVMPNGQDYQPQDQNYPQRYGNQDWQQPMFAQPRNVNPYAQPRYAEPNDPRFDPRNRRRYDPRYADDQEFDAPEYAPPRRYQRQQFPFGD